MTHLENTLKIFDEEFKLEDFDFSENKEQIKSFITQSHIKAYQSLIDKLTGEMFADPAQAGQFAMHSDGYNQSHEDIISHLQSLIKEAESNLK